MCVCQNKMNWKRWSWVLQLLLLLKSNFLVWWKFGKLCAWDLNSGVAFSHFHTLLNIFHTFTPCWISFTLSHFHTFTLSYFSQYLSDFHSLILSSISFTLSHFPQFLSGTARSRWSKTGPSHLETRGDHFCGKLHCGKKENNIPPKIF